MVLQVHDELLVEAPEGGGRAGADRSWTEEMHRAADLKVSLEIDMHEGNSWYEAK